MLNESGIYPKGHRVLVLPFEVEHKTASGIVLHTNETAKKEEMAQVQGIVIELGSTAYADQTEEWCQVGDNVIFAKYALLVYDGKDGKKYRILNDLDIVAKVN